MHCEFSNCKEWRGVKQYSNNEGYFYLCKRHAKRANSRYIKKTYKLTDLKEISHNVY